ncbi:MAG: heme-binding protein [bacterium]
MTEKPKYALLNQRKGYEIREYDPAVVAEVVVEGPYGNAMDRGFALLADYIFGNNRRNDAILMAKPVTASERIPMTSPVIASESLPMTAPVTISENLPMTAPVTISESLTVTAPVTISENLPMTAPVTISESLPVTTPETETSSQGTSWRVAFFAPSHYSLKRMPIPNNPAVHLRQLPKRKLAVLRFRGLANGHRVRIEIENLRTMLIRDGLHPLEPLTVARFNPPFVPAPFMLNEFQVEIAEEPPI